MTVREAIALLHEPKKVSISWDGLLVCFNFQNPIEVDAWGDYIIRSISATGEFEYELILAARPMRKGETA